MDDQVGAPTSSMQLAQATARLVRQFRRSRSGSFLPVSTMPPPTEASPGVDLRGPLLTLQAEAGEPLRVRHIVPIGSDEYPTPARRPLNSVLSNDKFERTFGFRLGSWQQGLAEVVREIRLREANRSTGNDAR